MATSTKASKKDHKTTRVLVFSLMARCIRSRTSMYSCSCLAPVNAWLNSFTCKKTSTLVTANYRKMAYFFRQNERSPVLQVCCGLLCPRRLPELHQFPCWTWLPWVNKSHFGATLDSVIETLFIMCINLKIVKKSLKIQLWRHLENYWFDSILTVIKYELQVWIKANITKRLLERVKL